MLAEGLNVKMSFRVSEHNQHELESAIVANDKCFKNIDKMGLLRWMEKRRIEEFHLANETRDDETKRIQACRFVEFV